MRLNFFLLLFLFWVTGCATRYILPGNRFLTPETQGEALRGHVEVQQTNANLLSINTNNGNVNNGVLYSDLKRMSFQASSSFFDPFDLYWSHTASSVSMFGFKYQFIGGSRVSRSAGHKLAIALGVGGNDYETHDKSVRFRLDGQENYLIYGYRLSEFLMPYANVSLTNYSFNGKITSSDPALNGASPSYKTRILAASGGVELTYGSFISKLECAYQQLSTPQSPARTRFIFGYSVGISW